MQALTNRGKKSPNRVTKEMGKIQQNQARILDFYSLPKMRQDENAEMSVTQPHVCLRFHVFVIKHKTELSAVKNRKPETIASESSIITFWNLLSKKRSPIGIYFNILVLVIQ